MHERRLHLSVVCLLAGRHHQPVTKPDTSNYSVPAGQLRYLYSIFRMYRCLHDAFVKRQANMGQEYTHFLKTEFQSSPRPLPERKAMQTFLVTVVFFSSL